MAKIPDMLVDRRYHRKGDDIEWYTPGHYSPIKHRAQIYAIGYKYALVRHETGELIEVKMKCTN